MQRILAIGLAISYMLFGCQKDDEPGVRIGFTTSSSSIREGETITIQFTTPLPDDVEPKIKVAGTASQYSDYRYNLSEDRTSLVVITYQDEVYDNESLEIQLEGFSGGAASGDINKHIVEIQEASLLIKVSWTALEGRGDNVDMNLALWHLESGHVFFVKSATTRRYDGEVIFLPANVPDGTYGITYQYYSGGATKLKFVVTFSTTVGSIDGEIGKSKTFWAQYTGANINDTNVVNIEQIVVKTGNNYHSFSTIQIPDYGS